MVPKHAYTHAPRDISHLLTEGHKISLFLLSVRDTSVLEVLLNERVEVAVGLRLRQPCVL